METFACANPECVHRFAAEEAATAMPLRCPRCGTLSAPRSLELDSPAALLPPPDAFTRERPPSPAEPTPVPAPTRDNHRTFYLLRGRERIGPLDKDRLLAAGMEHYTLVWYPGADRWRPAQDIIELRDVLHWVPPPAPGVSQWAFYSRGLPKPRSFATLFYTALWLGAAALLCFFLMILFLILYENVRAEVFDPHGHMHWTRNQLWEVLAIVFGVSAIPLILTSLVFLLVLLYQMWVVIQDGYTPYTPIAAVFLLFVPIFNIAWIFFAICGLARESNYYLERHGLMVRPAPVGLALACCIVLLVPFVNVAVGLPLLYVTMGILKNTAADIAEARQAEIGEGPGRSA